MIKNLMKGLAVTALICLSTVNFAKANEKPVVKCYCAFWGGNDKCLSSNGGSLCASGEDVLCQSFNSNCAD